MSGGFSAGKPEAHRVDLPLPAVGNSGNDWRFGQHMKKLEIRISKIRNKYKIPMTE
jgi:hypothetical protein